MRILTVNRRMTVLACGLSLLTLASFVASNHFTEEADVALQRQFDQTLAAVELRRGSDILTASVRAYAATGDERHRQAYQAELLKTRSRERALATLRSSGENPGTAFLEAAKARVRRTGRARESGLLRSGKEREERAGAGDRLRQ